MTALAHEIRMMQNPCLGAVLLWRFAAFYTEAHPTHAAAPLPLLFLPLPLAWHEGTAQHIASTRLASGLRAFAAKFTESNPSQLDVLLNLNTRAILWRPKTLASIRVALATGLLRLGPNGNVLPGSNAWLVERQLATVRAMCSAMEKLGAWFAPLSLREVTLALHIRF